VIDSFQPLGGAESRAVGPRRIRIVSAGPADTVLTLAAQMNVDTQSVLQFQVLNGMDRNQAVTTGERYKIVGN
jgi:predicted Zn-dependent protease